MKKNKTSEALTPFLNRVLQGDCLKILPAIPDKSIDLILCDPPYGQTNNPWDKIIDLNQLWSHYKRIIKDRGCIILTAQGLFTAKVIISNPEMFKFKIIWIKSRATNFLNARKQPLRKHEDICVFYKKQPVYNPQKKIGLPYNKGWRKHQTGSYGEMKPSPLRNESGQRYPTDVLFLCDDYVYIKTAETKREPTFHPTQKPVELGRYLVRTFSNPGDVVLDNACGCGSFLVAAKLESRNFIGIELNENAYKKKSQKIDFIKICQQRLDNAER
ncbi:site-specific DNA-methyltransferase (adenine-specific)/modification methylase [Chitinophaga terrae (ex Kim and Jung 2007)]|uniref:DNA-methyltransferase n=1 Tax=Chitinophaga terrae (ex Kim and Jung 2007) TaxID=408074 RepID=UPI00278AF76D|nr:site-specific DNA-methyltransferase [Chitinophaga terrae (ex Kim and Jung 2007)]MDQ0107446.1 site-specific DNA-methyltransferase (adenine-specific)/modification methylase [Chitinophaga terrae (ex Kim and Jung 2007)]